MTAVITILALIGGFVILGGLLILGIRRAAQEQGRLEERNEENARQELAKRKADAVLAEHRDPDGVSERLRQGDF